MTDSRQPEDPDRPLSRQGQEARARVEGPIRDLVDLEAFQAASDPPAATGTPAAPTAPPTPAEPVTEADVTAYIELTGLAAEEDLTSWAQAHGEVHAAAAAERAATTDEQRASAHGDWITADGDLRQRTPRARFWVMLLGALILGLGAAAVAGLIVSQRGAPTAPTAGEAGSSAPGAGGPSTIPVTSVSGLLLMRESGASYYGDVAPGSDQSVTLTLDPATMQATGTLDVAFTLPEGSKDADEEYAEGSLRSTFTVPILAATSTPPPGYPADESYHWDPAEGSWWFGGEVPVDVAMEGKDAASISRWEDGREEVEYTEASGSTTMTAWISGTAEPSSEGWSTTLTIEHSTPITDEPFWQLSFYSGGAGAIPGLERSAG